MASEQQLFVAIVTGQNVSNFPPILERGQAGDMVLWLESPQVARTNWREPAERVLQKAGLAMLPPLAVPAQANAAVWQERLRESVARCRQQQWQPVLVLNGGHKLMAVILWEIWRELRPKLIYNYDRPAALWVSESGLEGPCQLIPYSRHRLDLEDVLNLNHYQFHAPPQPGCLWSSYDGTTAVVGQPRAEEPLQSIESLVAQSYVSQPWRPLYELVPEAQLRPYITRALPELWKKNVLNFATARRRHEQLYKNLYHAALHVLKSLPIFEHCEPAYYDEMVRLAEKSKLEQWQEELWKLIPRKESLPPLTPELLERPLLTVCQQVYVLGPELTSPKREAVPNMTAGQEFELAVASRVVNFLENNAQARQIVQSVYSRVKVGPSREPHSVIAELDVLLTLKNGILIHIECKTGVWDRKDLDARLTNLRRLGSSIAVLAICAPLFTEPESSTLMRAHNTRVQLERIPDIFYLPFTKPGQPRGYTIQDINGELQTYEVETFEKALSRLLQPYMLCP